MRRRSFHRGLARWTRMTPPFHLHPLYRVTHRLRDFASEGVSSTYAKPRQGGATGLAPRPPTLAPRSPTLAPRPPASAPASGASSGSRRWNGDSGFSRSTSTERTAPKGAKRARSSSSRSSRGSPPTCSRAAGCFATVAMVSASVRVGGGGGEFSFPRLRQPSWSGCSKIQHTRVSVRALCKLARRRRSSRPRRQQRWARRDASRGGAPAR